MKEIWKDVVGFEGIYTISNFGNVRNTKRNKLLKTRKEPAGYITVSLYKNKSYFFRVHRLVAISFIKNPKNKKQINHRDLDKTNNKVSNLEWVTCKENLVHARKNIKYNYSRGTMRGSPKINESDVKEIRRLHSLGELGYSTLGRMFGLSESSIRKTVKRLKWKRVV